MKAEHDNRNRHGRTQAQREEIVYPHDVDRSIAGVEDCLEARESLISVKITSSSISLSVDFAKISALGLTEVCTPETLFILFIH